MSRTLSVLIVENFVITEGPKWEKVKRGAKTAAILVPWILGGGLAHNANAAQKDADDNKADYISYTNDARMANSGADEYHDKAWNAVIEGDIEKARNLKEVSKENAKMAAVAKERADRASKLAKEKQIESHASSAGAGAGAATGVAALLALKKDKKKKQEKKSLKERLELVKSGMFLNEEALNEGVILTAVAVTSLGLASLLTAGLAKLAINMETKSMITNFANILRNDKDSEITVNVMNNIVKKNGSKEEKEQFKKLYNELLSLVSRGKLELIITTDKKEVLDKRVHNVTGFLQKDEENKKINKFSDEKSEQAYLLIKRMYEIYKSVSDRITQPKKEENKSLKERLELVKSGKFLNEESADIIALRNKISQGLILLPGLKGSAADKMEDSIRGWENQINKLKKK